MESLFPKTVFSALGRDLRSGGVLSNVHDLAAIRSMLRGIEQNELYFICSFYQGPKTVIMNGEPIEAYLKLFAHRFRQRFEIDNIDADGARYVLRGKITYVPKRRKILERTKEPIVLPFAFRVHFTSKAFVCDYAEIVTGNGARTFAELSDWPDVPKRDEEVSEVGDVLSLDDTEEQTVVGAPFGTTNKEQIEWIRAIMEQLGDDAADRTALYNRGNAVTVNGLFWRTWCYSERNYKQKFIVDEIIPEGAAAVVRGRTLLARTAADLNRSGVFAPVESTFVATFQFDDKDTPKQVVVQTEQQPQFLPQRGLEYAPPPADDSDASGFGGEEETRARIDSDHEDKMKTLFDVLDGAQLASALLQVLSPASGLVDVNVNFQPWEVFTEAFGGLVHSTTITEIGVRTDAFIYEIQGYMTVAASEAQLSGSGASRLPSTRFGAVVFFDEAGDGVRTAEVVTDEPPERLLRRFKELPKPSKGEQAPTNATVTDETGAQTTSKDEEEFDALLEDFLDAVKQPSKVPTPRSNNVESLRSAVAEVRQRIVDIMHLSPNPAAASTAFRLFVEAAQTPSDTLLDDLVNALSENPKDKKKKQQQPQKDKEHEQDHTSGFFTSSLPTKMTSNEATILRQGGPITRAAFEIYGPIDDVEVDFVPFNEQRIAYQLSHNADYFLEWTLLSQMVIALTIITVVVYLQHGIHNQPRTTTDLRKQSMWATTTVYVSGLILGYGTTYLGSQLGFVMQYGRDRYWTSHATSLLASFYYAWQLTYGVGYRNYRWNAGYANASRAINAVANKVAPPDTTQQTRNIIRGVSVYLSDVFFRASLHYLSADPSKTLEFVTSFYTFGLIATFGSIMNPLTLPTAISYLPDLYSTAKGILGPYLFYADYDMYLRIANELGKHPEHIEQVMDATHAAATESVDTLRSISQEQQTLSLQGQTKGKKERFNDEFKAFKQQRVNEGKAVPRTYAFFTSGMDLEDDEAYYLAMHPDEVVDIIKSVMGRRINPSPDDKDALRPLLKTAYANRLHPEWKFV